MATWADTEIRFDISYSEMHLLKEEIVLDRLENIEDTKANGGDKGRMFVTNLRIIWHSIASPQINLCIGYKCIIAIKRKTVNSQLKGTTEALNLLTNFNGTRFEFIFTNLVPGNTRHFTSVTGVYKAYTSSKLYRELKLRGAVVNNKQLKILPLEQVFNCINGVWNLSSDQGSPGTFVITNIRLVWFAYLNEGFNVSLPYIQIENIKIRDSKFGLALVITTTERSGHFVLGFKMDTDEKLDDVFKELTSRSSAYSKKPIFGVEYKWEFDKEKGNSVPRNQLFVDDFQEEEYRGESLDPLIAYLSNENKVFDKPPVYSQELGLAIEKIKEGYNLEKLWSIVHI